MPAASRRSRRALHGLECSRGRQGGGTYIAFATSWRASRWPNATRGSRSEVGINLQPGQRARDQRILEHAPLRCARSPSGPTRPARASSMSSTRISTCARAHIQHASEERARLVAAVARQAPRRPRRGGRRAARDAAGTPSRSSSPTSTGRASPRSRMRGRLRGQPAADQRPLQLVDRRLPERRLGATGLRRARSRAALGCRRHGGAARRARPGERMAGAHRATLDARRSGAERAPLRRAPLPRAGNRPDDRPASGFDGGSPP